ncbi:hypothetical protein C1645_763454, partial [Glomus cerebriforme]
MKDENLIYSSNYRFTIDIEDLLNNSTKTRRAKRYEKKRINKPPRPQNAFIIYRRNKVAELKIIFEGQKSANISRIVGEYWREEEKEVKELFEAISRVAEKRHSDKYKDYVYEPKKPNPNRKKAKKAAPKRQTNDKNSTIYPSPTLTDISNFSLSDSNYSNSEFYPSPISNSNNSPLIDNDEINDIQEIGDVVPLVPSLNDIQAQIMINDPVVTESLLEPVDINYDYYGATSNLFQNDFFPN